jgi:ribosome recycling factor
MGEMTWKKGYEHEKRIQDLEKSYGEMKNEMHTVRTGQPGNSQLLNQLIVDTLGIKKQVKTMGTCSFCDRSIQWQM